VFDGRLLGVGGVTNRLLNSSIRATAATLAFAALLAYSLGGRGVRWLGVGDWWPYCLAVWAVVFLASLMAAKLPSRKTKEAARESLSSYLIGALAWPVIGGYLGLQAGAPSDAVGVLGLGLMIAITLIGALAAASSRSYRSGFLGIGLLWAAFLAGWAMSARGER